MNRSQRWVLVAALAVALGAIAWSAVPMSGRYGCGPAVAEAWSSRRVAVPVSAAQQRIDAWATVGPPPTKPTPCRALGRHHLQGSAVVLGLDVIGAIVATRLLGSA